MLRTLLQRHIGRIRDLTPSTEAISTDGVEREYVFFGQMVDKEDLEKASRFEDQEQYRILVPCKEKGREISVRIRKTVCWNKTEKGLFADDAKYHLTIKSFMKGEDGNVEAENDLDAAAGEKMLEIFKYTGDGLIKRRYMFPCGKGYREEGKGDSGEYAVRMSFPPEMEWEVDVPKEFNSSDDLTRSEVQDSNCWVKLDLEVLKWSLKVKDDSFDVPFPIRLKNVIYQQPGKRDKETEAKVKRALDQLRTKK